MEYGVKERRHSWIVSLGDLVIVASSNMQNNTLYCCTGYLLHILKSAPIQTNEFNYWKVLNDEQKMYSFWNNTRAQNNVQNTDISKQ